MLREETAGRYGKSSRLRTASGRGAHASPLQSRTSGRRAAAAAVGGGAALASEDMFATAAADTGSHWPAAAAWWPQPRRTGRTAAAPRVAARAEARGGADSDGDLQPAKPLAPVSHRHAPSVQVCGRGVAGRPRGAAGARDERRGAGRGARRGARGGHGAGAQGDACRQHGGGGAKERV